VEIHQLKVNVEIYRHLENVIDFYRFANLVDSTNVMNYTSIYWVSLISLKMSLNETISKSSQKTVFYFSFLKFFPEKFLLLKHNIFFFENRIKVIEVVWVSIQGIEESIAGLEVLNWNNNILLILIQIWSLDFNFVAHFSLDFFFKVFSFDMLI